MCCTLCFIGLIYTSSTIILRLPPPPSQPLPLPQLCIDILLYIYTLCVMLLGFIEALLCISSRPRLWYSTSKIPKKTLVFLYFSLVYGLLCRAAFLLLCAYMTLRRAVAAESRRRCFSHKRIIRYSDIPSVNKREKCRERRRMKNRI